VFIRTQALEQRRSEACVLINAGGGRRLLEVLRCPY